MQKLRNSNWLENWRMKRLESLKENRKTPEKKIIRKLVTSKKKKIGGKLENSPDIRIAFKKIAKKNKMVEVNDSEDEA